jgi:hypothetical protein
VIVCEPLVPLVSLLYPADRTPPAMSTIRSARRSDRARL